MSNNRPLNLHGVLSPPPELRDGRSADSRPDPIDPRLQALIGEQLRSLYGTLLNQPIPDRLRALVDRLGESGPSEREEAPR